MLSTSNSPISIGEGKVEIRDGGVVTIDGNEIAALKVVVFNVGTRPVATDRIYRQGDFRTTGNPLDLVIEGKGFFQVGMPSGELAYTRDGSFHLNSEGVVVTSAGNPLEPQITIPSDAQEIVIGSDGTVSVTQAGQLPPNR